MSLDFFDKVASDPVDGREALTNRQATCPSHSRL